MACAGTQSHSRSYPLSAMSPRTVPIPSPSSAATFSTIAYRGCTMRMVRTSSQYNPERSPEIPARFPACDTSWHGKPPHTTSALPHSALIVRTSSWQGVLGQCLASTARGNGSISQKATVSNPPVRSKPRVKPPTNAREQIKHFQLGRLGHYLLSVDFNHDGHLSDLHPLRPVDTLARGHVTQTPSS